MYPSDDPSAPCPEGVEDARIASLVDDPEDTADRAHTLRCGVCAERYLDHVLAAAVVRRLAAETRRCTRSARPVQGSVLRLPSVPLAAAILAGVAGLAVAAAILVTLRLVAPGPAGLGRVSDLELRARLDLRAAGLDDLAVIDGWATVVLARDRVGTVVAATRDPARHVTVAGFASDGSLLWTSSGDSWGEIARLDNVRVGGIGSVLTRAGGDDLEERVWVLASRWNTGALVLADPSTGEVTGTYTHPGHLGRAMRDGTRVLTLPAPPGALRRLLVTGHHHHEGESHLCLSVIEPDGTRVQHLRIPNLLPTVTGPADVLTIVDWTPGRESLTLQTSQGVVFRFPCANGELSVAGVTATFDDTARTAYDLAKRGAAPGFDEWIASKDPVRGRKIVLDELARGVVPWDFDPPASLGGR